MSFKISSVGGGWLFWSKFYTKSISCRLSLAVIAGDFGYDWIWPILIWGTYFFLLVPALCCFFWVIYGVTSKGLLLISFNAASFVVVFTFECLFGDLNCIALRGDSILFLSLLRGLNLDILWLNVIVEGIYDFLGRIDFSSGLILKFEFDSTRGDMALLEMAGVSSISLKIFFWALLRL